jgi:phage shock protein C
MSAEVKRVYRSKNERMLAGVCGGLGEYFNLDPTIMRALFIAFGLIVGGGILLYIILWILIPEEPEATELTGDVPVKETE